MQRRRFNLESSGWLGKSEASAWIFLPVRSVITARRELRKVLFLALPVTFLFVCESNISGTAERICTKVTGRRVWSLARTSFNVKVKGQGHQEQKLAVHSHHLPTAMRMGPFCCMTHSTRSLQTTSCSGRRDHSVTAGE